MKIYVALALLLLTVSPTYANDGLPQPCPKTNVPLHLLWSCSDEGQFNAKVIFLADQLERNIDRKSFSNTILVTSFPNLDNLRETNSLGRLIAENLIHELQVRGWHIIDARLTKDVIINDNGEFSLSRDIQKIKETYSVGGIITGTYTISDTSIIVNARAISLDSGLVTSSGQMALPINSFTESMLYNHYRDRPMKIIGGY